MLGGGDYRRRCFIVLTGWGYRVVVFFSLPSLSFPRVQILVVQSWNSDRNEGPSEHYRLASPPYPSQRWQGIGTVDVSMGQTRMVMTMAMRRNHHQTHHEQTQTWGLLCLLLLLASQHQRGQGSSSFHWQLHSHMYFSMAQNDMPSVSICVCYLCDTMREEAH